jgi:hypothetical protein
MTATTSAQTSRNKESSKFNPSVTNGPENAVSTGCPLFECIPLVFSESIGDRRIHISKRPKMTQVWISPSHQYSTTPTFVPTDARCGLGIGKIRHINSRKIANLTETKEI